MRTGFLAFFVRLLADFWMCHSKPDGGKTGQDFPSHRQNIRFVGRIDFRDPLWPRFYQPGIYFEAIFKGKDCRIIVRDQQLWGQNQNYLQVVVDGESRRIQTTGAIDTIEVASGLPEGRHTLLVCKDTEANIGWLELGGIICNKLLSLPPPPRHKIEFIEIPSLAGPVPIFQAFLVAVENGMINTMLI